MTSVLRSLFGFLVVRAPRNRLAAFTAALLALLFARRLMREAAISSTPRDRNHRRRIFDGECRRIG